MKKETILKKAAKVKQLVAGGMAAKKAIAKAGLQAWQYYGLNRAQKTAKRVNRPASVKLAPPATITVTFDQLREFARIISA